MFQWFFERGADPGFGDGAIREREGCGGLRIVVVDESDDEVVVVVFGGFEVIDGYAVALKGDEALVLVGC